MLNAIAFSESLRQALGDGIETIMVVSLSGDLIGCASSATKGDAAYMEQGLLSAAATNMWAAYANNDLSRPQQQAMGFAGPSVEGLEAMYTVVGNNKMCLLSVGGTALLCLSGQNAELGMLKTKGAALQRHLDGPLRQVMKS